MVAAARGGPRLPSVLRHMVHRPLRVTIDGHLSLSPLTISVEGADGTRTVIRIGRDPDISS